MTKEEPGQSSEINIWDRYCNSFPSLLIFSKPMITKEYGKRTLLFRKDGVDFKLTIDLSFCTEQEKSVPCSYYLTVHGSSRQEKNGDLMDTTFVMSIYETLEKYFSPS
jgi:hypothetical protein